MRGTIQSGHHPDADQISAFVEHALPAHEQQDMLAHLAICPECRRAVAMSLPPESESAAQVIEHKRSKWFSGWGLALPAGVVFATVLLLGIYVRNLTSLRHQVGAPSQIAASHPPAPPAVSRQSTAPGSRSPSLDRKSATASRELAPGPVSRKVGQFHAQAGDRAMSTKEPLAQANELAAPSGAPHTASHPMPVSGSGADAASNSVALAAPAELTPSAAGEAGATRQTFAGKIVLPLPPATGANGGPILKKAVNAPALSLPSGLPVVSMAAYRRQIVAIDAQNSVFLSNDRGTTWTAIPIPWKGRAVKADLVSYESGNGTRQGPRLGSRPPAYVNPAHTPEQLQPTNSPLQASGATLTGTVSDATGAVIPGASVTASAPSGRFAGTAVTGRDGRYAVNGLDPGIYDLKTRAPGFQQQLTQGINVVPSRPNVTNIVLAVGMASESVEVESADSLVATQAPSQSKMAKTTSAPAIFEITTSTGDHWTSLDGLNWKRK